MPKPTIYWSVGDNAGLGTTAGLDLTGIRMGPNVYPIPCATLWGSIGGLVNPEDLLGWTNQTFLDFTNAFEQSIKDYVPEEGSEFSWIDNELIPPTFAMIPPYAIGAATAPTYDPLAKRLHQILIDMPQKVRPKVRCQQFGWPLPMSQEGIDWDDPTTADAIRKANDSAMWFWNQQRIIYTQIYNVAMAGGLTLEQQQSYVAMTSYRHSMNVIEAKRVADRALGSQQVWVWVMIRPPDSTAQIDQRLMKQALELPRRLGSNKIVIWDNYQGFESAWRTNFNALFAPSYRSLPDD